MGQGNKMKKRWIFLILGLVLAAVFFSMIGNREETPAIERENKIPADAVKMTPESDSSPVKSLSSEYYEPVPVSGVVNTAGAEDSPFILPAGDKIYFFFTPDVRVPVEKQVADGVTGIYVSRKVNGEWQKAERVILQDRGKLALDGCEFVLGNKMWFCSVREGYSGIHWFSAEFKDGAWKNWKNADSELKTKEYETGELHIYGDELYFHSSRAGGKGGLDIWVSKKINGEWGEPENVAGVNSEGNEGWPALSPDGNELWISRDYALWRSKRTAGGWTIPEKMFSPLAGEASIDSEGNVYFVHHFYEDNKMIEADIYVAKRK